MCNSRPWPLVELPVIFLDAFVTLSPNLTMSIIINRFNIFGLCHSTFVVAPAEHHPSTCYVIVDRDHRNKLRCLHFDLTIHFDLHLVPSLSFRSEVYHVSLLSDVTF